MTLIGRHLLPSYQEATHTPDLSDLDSEYRLRDFLTELHVEPNSPLIGKTVSESHLGEEYDMTIIGVLHNEEVRLGILPDTYIQAGDILIARGESKTILAAMEKLGTSNVSGQVLTTNDLRSAESTVAEIVVSQLAGLIGKTLKDVNFRGRYDLNVLAIWREEAPIRGRLAEVPLRMGDTLLVHGPRERIRYPRQ
jgi:K+/H+ antiporter YhaU regulatory subunit KhtT